jgi:hypothetical protein
VNPAEREMYCERAEIIYEEGELLISGTAGGKAWGTGIVIGEEPLDFAGDNFLAENIGGDVDVGG